ncbi:MAG TPA: hypothetical protein VN238_13970 [Solirubrobacteraceae bacterium]|nr:hypothetical protein [Solirubrobacteraceae bacterium]
MNRLIQEALVVGLAHRLHANGSWTGETHLQKAAYLLSELRDVDLGFNFILYKHGPFSFGLRDEISAMRGEELLDSVVPNPRYGAQLMVTRRGQDLEHQLQKTMQRYGPDLDWIAEKLGSRGVMDLERLATAMWMTREHEGASVRQRASALVRVKPHITLEDAIEAVEEIDALLGERSTARPA